MGPEESNVRKGGGKRRQNTEKLYFLGMDGSVANELEYKHFNSNGK